MPACQHCACLLAKPCTLTYPSFLLRRRALTPTWSTPQGCHHEPLLLQVCPWVPPKHTLVFPQLFPFNLCAAASTAALPGRAQTVKIMQIRSIVFLAVYGQTTYLGAISLKTDCAQERERNGLHYLTITIFALSGACQKKSQLQRLLMAFGQPHKAANSWYVT